MIDARGFEHQPNVEACLGSCLNEIFLRTCGFQPQQFDNWLKMLLTD